MGCRVSTWPYQPEICTSEERPKSATTPEIIEQVHDMLLDDGRMKVREIAETTGISKEGVR
jgi:hypothetical protein